VLLKLDIEEVFFDSKIMMPLSLIINEAITNSLKYAFNNQENAAIIVRLKQLEDDKNELYIADNGIGYDSDKAKAGLGTKLIQSFTKQLEGKIEKVLSKGTAYKLRF